MAVREVLRFPHPALKQSAAAIEAGDPRARQVIRDVVDTMRAHPVCVGLAAPQLDAAVRIVAVDVTGHHKAPENAHGLIVLLNPRIVSAAGAEVAREGCLSIPDLTANVRRATTVAIEAHDPDGARTRIEAEGFEARCLVHELDHLDGILFLDRVDSLGRDVFRRKRYR